MKAGVATDGTAAPRVAGVNDGLSLTRLSTAEGAHAAMLDSLVAKMATRPTPNRLIYIRHPAFPNGQLTSGSACYACDLPSHFGHP